MKIKIDLERLAWTAYILGLTVMTWACLGIGAWLIYKGFTL